MTFIICCDEGGGRFPRTLRCSDRGLWWLWHCKVPPHEARSTSLLSRNKVTQVPSVPPVSKTLWPQAHHVVKQADNPWIWLVIRSAHNWLSIER